MEDLLEKMSAYEDSESEEYSNVIWYECFNLQINALKQKNKLSFLDIVIIAWT